MKYTHKVSQDVEVSLPGRDPVAAIDLDLPRSCGDSSDAILRSATSPVLGRQLFAKQTARGLDFIAQLTLHIPL